MSNELERLRDWNRRVSVCKDHTRDIIDGPCVICALERAKAVNAQLVEALLNLDRAYVRLLESARDRIIDYGGDCDPVDVMERSDPYLADARKALAKVSL